MSKLLSQIKSLFYKKSADEIDDFDYPDYEPQIDNYHFPINQQKAFYIAKQDQNLKTDFVKQINKQYTGIFFNNYKIDLVTKNNRQYWHIKITDTDVSWVEDNTLCDGFLLADELELLQCYIDVKTGQYIYYKDF